MNTVTFAGWVLVGLACGALEAEQRPYLHPGMIELTAADYRRAAAASDSDADGLSNLDDVCPSIADPDQLDRDGDRVGDACDACPDSPAPGLIDGCPEPEEPWTSRGNPGPTPLHSRSVRRGGGALDGRSAPVLFR